MNTTQQIARWKVAIVCSIVLAMKKRKYRTNTKEHPRNPPLQMPTEYLVAMQTVQDMNTNANKILNENRLRPSPKWQMLLATRAPAYLKITPIYNTNSTNQLIAQHKGCQFVKTLQYIPMRVHSVRLPWQTGYQTLTLGEWIKGQIVKVYDNKNAKWLSYWSLLVKQIKMQMGKSVKIIQICQPRYNSKNPWIKAKTREERNKNNWGHTIIKEEEKQF